MISDKWLEVVHTNNGVVVEGTVKIKKFRLEEEIFSLGPKLFRLFLMRLEKMNEIFTSGDRKVEEM